MNVQRARRLPRRRRRGTQIFRESEQGRRTPEAGGRGRRKKRWRNEKLFRHQGGESHRLPHGRHAVPAEAAILSDLAGLAVLVIGGGAFAAAIRRFVVHAHRWMLGGSLCHGTGRDSRQHARHTLGRDGETKQQGQEQAEAAHGMESRRAQACGQGGLAAPVSIFSLNAGPLYRKR